MKIVAVSARCTDWSATVIYSRHRRNFFEVILIVDLCSVLMSSSGEEVLMARSTTRPIVKMRSTGGTGYTYVTRKSRRNDPDRLVLRKYDPILRGYVEFREER